MLLCADIEADGLTPSKIHVICVSEYPSGIKRTFTDMKEFEEFVDSNKIDKWFFHNGLAYDVPVINRLIRENLIDPNDVVDTSVVAKLMDYHKYFTFSLKELGEDLGVYKGDYTGGWEYLNVEMIEYCEQDVEVLKAIVKHYWADITNPTLKDAMRVEHDMAILCQEMEDNGFYFDVPKAEGLLEEIKSELEVLDKSLEDAYGKKLVEVKRLKSRTTKDGRYFKSITDNISKYPKSELDGDEWVFYDYKVFNPDSPIDRIDLLWDAGWKPVEKTKGHIKKLKER